MFLCKRNEQGPTGNTEPQKPRSNYLPYYINIDK